MKKFMLVLLSIVSLSIISCESDEDATTPTNTNAPENTEEAVVVETEVEVETEQEVEVEVETEEETETEEVVEALKVIRVSQVNTSTNEVTFTNFGNVTTDIGNYFLCLGPGTYRQISSLTTSATMIATGESVTVVYSLIDAASDGLSVFTTNTFGSTDPEILIDYVQWGAANQQRVNQAVTAGRWNNADAFLQTSTTYTFNGQATEFGVSFWSGN